MVGVSPAGTVAFISKGYGGRTSGKAIFEDSKVLDLLVPVQDTVMVHKGFLVDVACEERLIEMVRPPFKGKSAQLSKSAALETQSIASARVHVERSIQRLKIFKILNTKVPWTMVPILDDIITIAGAVTNLSAPIFSEDKFL